MLTPRAIQMTSGILLAPIIDMSLVWSIYFLGGLFHHSSGKLVHEHVVAFIMLDFLYIFLDVLTVPIMAVLSWFAYKRSPVFGTAMFITGMIFSIPLALLLAMDAILT